MDQSICGNARQQGSGAVLGRRFAGAEVTLMPRLPDHIPTMYRWYDYPDFYQRLRTATYGRFFDHYRRQAGADDSLLWSILITGTDEPHGKRGNQECGPELIGITSLFQCRRSRESRDSYTFIIPEARGRGYAVQALELRANYAFSAFSMDVLQTAVDQDNGAIHHVLEKVGYRSTGRAYWQRREQDMYVLRRPWWEGKREQLSHTGE